MSEEGSEAARRLLETYDSMLGGDVDKMRFLLLDLYPEGKTQSSVPDLWDLETTCSLKINPKTDEPGFCYSWQLQKCAICGNLERETPRERRSDHDSRASGRIERDYDC
jgi:hypothetical protein